MGGWQLPATGAAGVLGAGRMRRDLVVTDLVSSGLMSRDVCRGIAG